MGLELHLDPASKGALSQHCNIVYLPRFITVMLLFCVFRAEAFKTHTSAASATDDEGKYRCHIIHSRTLMQHNSNNVLLILHVKYFYNRLRFKVVID